jgi:hypothetical protein
MAVHFNFYKLRFKDFHVLLYSFSIICLHVLLRSVCFFGFSATPQYSSKKTERGKITPKNIRNNLILHKSSVYPTLD